MNILLVAATEMESAAAKDHSSPHSCDYLVTGPGMVATAYALARKLGEKRYDLVLNIGLAGSFDRSLAIGEAVLVKEDTFSELGAEDGNQFIGLPEMGLPFTGPLRPTATSDSLPFKKVNGITVNTVHGKDSSIKDVLLRFNPQVETMEGAAFFYVCEKEKVPALQLRAISNYVERRNKAAWNVPLALENLQRAVNKTLTHVERLTSRQDTADDLPLPDKEDPASTLVPVSKPIRAAAGNSQRFTLGISPCPNDTFSFDALINERIDTPGMTFEVNYEDVESLNRNAQLRRYDIVKISFAAYAGVMDNYQLLTAGSALGNGVGPLLVAKKNYRDTRNIRRVAVPGKNTTAFFLLQLFYPDIADTPEYVFSGIEDAVQQEAVDAGVIIHENRFTYSERGLIKISDLGELWEKKTGLPVPLGGIAVRRNLPDEIKRKINTLVGQSVRFAFAHPAASLGFVKSHAQEMNPEVMQKHIALYVNEYSADLGETGRKTILEFLRAGRKNLDLPEDDIFILSDELSKV